MAWVMIIVGIIMLAILISAIVAMLNAYDFADFCHEFAEAFPIITIILVIVFMAVGALLVIIAGIISLIKG